MESSMTNDMHLGIDEADSYHPYGVSSESVVGCEQEFHNLLNVRHPYGVSPSPVGTQDIKQADSSPAHKTTTKKGRNHRSQANAQTSVGMTWLLSPPSPVGTTEHKQAT